MLPQNKGTVSYEPSQGFTSKLWERDADNSIQEGQNVLLYLFFNRRASWPKKLVLEV